MPIRPSSAIATILATSLLAATGCGGGNTAPDGAAIERIQDASIALGLECALPDHDAAKIQRQVNQLVKEADAAGDASFKLGKFHNMREVLLRDADGMHDMHCQPAQERRLRDAAP